MYDSVNFVYMLIQRALWTLFRFSNGNHMIHNKHMDHYNIGISKLFMLIGGIQ